MGKRELEPQPHNTDQRCSLQDNALATPSSGTLMSFYRPLLIIYAARGINALPAPRHAKIKSEAFR